MAQCKNLSGNKTALPYSRIGSQHAACAASRTKGNQMDPQFKAMVVDEWTANSTTAAWRKWHPKFAVQLAAMTAALVDAAGIKPGMRVLDIASGTGEPAITLSKLVGASGHVTATDLAADMLAIAEDNARAAGCTNVDFRQADAHELPVPDRSFDAVTVRLGAMDFWDCTKALAEIRRVRRAG